MTVHRESALTKESLCHSRLIIPPSDVIEGTPRTPAARPLQKVSPRLRGLTAGSAALGLVLTGLTGAAPAQGAGSPPGSEAVEALASSVDAVEPGVIGDDGVHDTGPLVRVNQLGYLPDGPKNATVVSDAEEPLSWRLLDADGAVLAQGESAPRGHDPSAGLDVHTVDFTEVDVVGEGLRLEVDGEASYPFTIAEDLYQGLRRDSLGIYYTQRSGQEITPIEVDGELLKTDYERPAGHVSEFGGEDVNQGDVAVPCLPPEGAVDDQGEAQLGADDHYGPEGWRCPEDYMIDASGGWYDAGDQGKYVVNSGISVYQLLSAYERSLHAGVVDQGALGDSTLVIPERDNGVPDILDEVRWNLEWMLSMQVEDGVRMTIDGEDLDAGGLVHHKLHDIAWTGLDTLPHEDPMRRYVHRPSTAATLNLAAAAAQGARLYEEYDADFAADLVAAAERAWRAAGEHPEILAPNTNELDPNPGGGPYDDDELGDEFYWAAAQLFLTTGDDVYADAVLDSPYHVGGEHGEIWGATSFDWGFTAAAGRLDLATVPNHLPGRAEVIDSVLEGADSFLATQQGEPFGHAYNPGDYDWGSTHQVINNTVIIATAYDLTGDQAYADGALESIDYILGRNAINTSYVTGYGTHYSQNMHSRWYASSDRLPPFPDGKLAGGPNSGIQDPVAQEHLPGCAPQACYIDHIESWSTNETTINWNAALAWYASWAADMGVGTPEWSAPAAACQVEFSIRGGGQQSTVHVDLENLGIGEVADWELTWDVAGDMEVRRHQGGELLHEGGTVRVNAEPGARALEDPRSHPGKGRTSTRIGFLAVGEVQAPHAVELDGVPCAVS